MLAPRSDVEPLFEARFGKGKSNGRANTPCRREMQSHVLRKGQVALRIPRERIAAGHTLKADLVGSDRTKCQRSLLE
jgi:hypothetical protein